MGGSRRRGDILQLKLKGKSPKRGDLGETSFSSRRRENKEVYGNETRIGENLLIAREKMRQRGVGHQTGQGNLDFQRINRTQNDQLGENSNTLTGKNRSRGPGFDN